jgi:formylglycine-generating enzyme required for sulfatase activity
MILIPAGSFEMGLGEEELDDILEFSSIPRLKKKYRSWFGNETPRRKLQVEAFYMDAHEVTNREFMDFVRASGYQSEGEWARYTGAGRLDHPIVNITWNDARAYAKWAGKRLPTEIEWEYAAKGGRDVNWFPWGDTPDDGTKSNYNHEGETFFSELPVVLRIKEKPRVDTKPVGSYGPNGFGLYDVIGNAAEMVEDTFARYPGGPEEGELLCKKTPAKEDKKELVPCKVVRGGAWNSSDPGWARLTLRQRASPHWYGWDIGFRCAKSIEE